MNKYVVEQVRIKAASGLYTLRDLFLDNKNKLSYPEFCNVLNYEVAKEVRADLHTRIIEVTKATEIYSKYQQELQTHATMSIAYEAKDRMYPYENYKEQLDDRLQEELSKLSTINPFEVKKFAI